MAPARSLMRDSSLGMQTVPPFISTERMSTKLASNVCAANCRALQSGVNRKGPVCASELDENALCSRTVPFGSPVDPEVKMRYAALPGLTIFLTATEAHLESRSSSIATTGSSVASASFDCCSEDVKTIFAPTFSMSERNRDSGCEGSKGTNAPPAFSTEYTAMVYHFWDCMVSY